MASKRTRANKPEMIHCPYCGEDYSSTYKHCPFCDEVEPAEDDYQTDEYDEAPRSRGGKRLVTNTRGGGYGGGTSPLKIIGTAAQISKLTGDSVFCTVDLSTVTDPSGSMEAPVTVTINNADSCWATGSYTAHVTLSPKTESSTSDASN